MQMGAILQHVIICRMRSGDSLRMQAWMGNKLEKEREKEKVEENEWSM